MNKLQKYKCLILDDERLFTFYLKKMLEVYGFEVLDLNQAKHALKLLKYVKFDVILSDVDMPEMNGIDFMEALNSNKITKTTPVLFVSNNDDPNTIERLLKLGAIGFLKKPVLKYQIDQIRKHIKEFYHPNQELFFE